MKKSIYSKIFDSFNIVFLILVAFITIYPFWNLAVLSLSDPVDAVRGGLYFWPRIFSFTNFRYIFTSTVDIKQAFFISVSRTVTGTVLLVIVTSALAFALSRDKLLFNKHITRFFLLTMYVNAGLIPVYLLISKIGLRNNFFVYIIPAFKGNPGLISAYFMMFIRTYIKRLPDSLSESAFMDGANDIQVFYKIIFPLCKPVLATVALFVAVAQWGSWADTYFFASRTKSLTTLQFELMKVISEMSTQASQQSIDQLAESKPTPETMKAAITMIATVPIIMVYPFLQKYFVKGLVIGAVKQ